MIQRKDEALVGVPLLLQDDLFKEHGSADGSNEFVGNYLSCIQQSRTFLIVHLKQPALAKLLSNFQNTLVAVGNVKEIRNAGALKSISLQIVKLYDAVLVCIVTITINSYFHSFPLITKRETQRGIL